MQEISRAILLPPPSPAAQRKSVRVVESDSNQAVEAARTKRQSQGAAQAFPTLIGSQSEDTVEIRGKQFRFRPYTSRGMAEVATRDAEIASESTGSEVTGAQSDVKDFSIDVLDGFGAHAGNSSAFLASLIAQERLQQGLYNPRFEAASNAYRRAGASPSAIDNQPRVVSFAV